jgi:hypothetical protein
LRAISLEITGVHACGGCRDNAHVHGWSAHEHVREYGFRELFEGVHAGDVNHRAGVRECVLSQDENEHVCAFRKLKNKPPSPSE